jgi:hypothetical protein
VTKLGFLSYYYKGPLSGVIDFEVMLRLESEADEAGYRPAKDRRKHHKSTVGGKQKFDLFSELELAIGDNFDANKDLQIFTGENRA